MENLLTHSHTDRSRRDLGRANRRAVLAELVFRGPIARTAIAQHTGLTAASVSRITRDLIDADLVRETGDVSDTGRPGRRFIQLDVNPAGGYVLGIALNVFQQSVTLADLKNQRIDRHDLGLSDLSDPDTVIDKIVEVAQVMIERHVSDRARLFGGSIAITGAVDPVSGVVRESPYLDWTEVPLVSRLEHRLDLPFRIESLPNAVNLAEARFGVGREHDNALLINCALGIGGSLYLDGRLARGRDFMAGFIGDLVPVGQTGAAQTLDDVAGGRGALLAAGATPDELDALPADKLAARLMDLVRAANGADTAAKQIFAQAGTVLGQSLALFAGLVRPDIVILSGPVAEARDFVSACAAAMAETGGKAVGGISVVTSDLSPQAAARLQAIGEFMVDRDIDLDGLKMKEAA